MALHDFLTSKLAQRLRDMRQVILYGVIGLSALALELAVYFVLSQRASVPIWLGNGAGVLAGLVFGFTLNARYNFRVNDRMTTRFLRYGMIALGGYILTTTLIFVITHGLHVEPFLAKLMSLPPYFLFQYNSNRLFTFQADQTLVPVEISAYEQDIDISS